MICFQISIFAESYTPLSIQPSSVTQLWFAFKLVSLQSHIHRKKAVSLQPFVVICFQISIFAESYTPWVLRCVLTLSLWFAFKLVSLQSHIHPWTLKAAGGLVVICFQISIFAESYTPSFVQIARHLHVVICFQISIFAESYTPSCKKSPKNLMLWFAFKLVSLQSHIHLFCRVGCHKLSCDLLSN